MDETTERDLGEPSVDAVTRADAGADVADLSPSIDEEQLDESDGVDDPGRPSRVAAWLLIVGGLALAGFFVAIPAHTYDLELSGRVTSDVRRIDLIELWRIQARNLPEVRYEGLFQALFLVCGAIVLLGSAALIWLATVEITPTTNHPAAKADGKPAESPSTS
jgi:hypothetical protein